MEDDPEVRLLFLSLSVRLFDLSESVMIAKEKLFSVYILAFI